MIGIEEFMLKQEKLSKDFYSFYKDELGYPYKLTYLEWIEKLKRFNEEDYIRKEILKLQKKLLNNFDISLEESFYHINNILNYNK